MTSSYRTIYTLLHPPVHLLDSFFALSLSLSLALSPLSALNLLIPSNTWLPRSQGHGLCVSVWISERTSNFQALPCENASKESHRNGISGFKPWCCSIYIYIYVHTLSIYILYIYTEYITKPQTKPSELRTSGSQGGEVVSKSNAHAGAV